MSEEVKIIGAGVLCELGDTVTKDLVCPICKHRFFNIEVPKKPLYNLRCGKCGAYIPW